MPYTTGSVANREAVAIRSSAPCARGNAHSVANREAVAIRSHTIDSPAMVVECSKSRSGRNPQQDDYGINRDYECSKSRSGRNPQRSMNPPNSSQ